MIKTIYSAIILLSVLLVLSSCTHNIMLADDALLGENRETKDMNNTDLRAFDEKENKMVIDVILDMVEEYPKNCMPSDFSFDTEMDEFILAFTQESEINGNPCLRAYYRLKNNTLTEDYNARVNLIFCVSKESSHKFIKNFVDGYTMVEVFASKIEVGDLALGGAKRVDFVRGNVSAYVEGYDGVEIEGLAKAVDLQILEIISTINDDDQRQ